MSLRFDVLIIGGGAAGLSLALRLASGNSGKSFEIALIMKRDFEQTSTYWAQGGIAAAYPQDGVQNGVVDLASSSQSIASHVADTLKAGAGLCDAQAVASIVGHSPEVIDWLISLGMPFTQVPGYKHKYHLTKEGGHSERRIFHVADATGKSLSQTLLAKIKPLPNVHVFTDAIAIDLITRAKLGLADNACIGVHVLRQADQKVLTLLAPITVLATGGASKVYAYTTNPDGNSGDGIAMAWRAGCSLMNMEFNQFHPTCLYHPYAKSFLLSEALRGEGARLVHKNGERFMDEHHQDGELAPRDVVARAIDSEMKRRGLDHVFLDISFKDQAFITSHFPMLYERCKAYGIDISKDYMPVVPAAHYTCGGIEVDIAGRTSLAGLYAIGECAHTGLHGANRLASNSLLECLVLGLTANQAIREDIKALPPLPLRVEEWDDSRVELSDEDIFLHHNWHELRKFMWNYVGIVRNDKRLLSALKRVDLLHEEVQDYYQHFKVNRDLIELRNLILIAKAIILSALKRKESRGLHYTLDYPGMIEPKTHSL